MNEGRIRSDYHVLSAFEGREDTPATKSHAATPCLQIDLFMANKYASVRAPWRPLLMLVLRPAMHPVFTLDSFLKLSLRKIDISQALTCVKGVVSTLIGRR